MIFPIPFHVEEYYIKEILIINKPKPYKKAVSCCYCIFCFHLTKNSVIININKHNKKVKEEWKTSSLIDFFKHVYEEEWRSAHMLRKVAPFHGYLRDI